MFSPSHFSIFFFNATATTEIYTLSLHDALPIFNLLLNACQAGGSPVTVTAEPLGAVCRISVFDRGSGIPDDVMERVFEAFYTTKKTGTGLGLPIVKRLMDLQGGTVTLRPREGGGTVAELTLPLAR